MYTRKKAFYRNVGKGLQAKHVATILNTFVYFAIKRDLYDKFKVYCQSFKFMTLTQVFNSLRPRQNGRHFPDDTFKRIFLYENVRISIKISMKFVPKGPINNCPSLVQMMAWRRPGDKTLSEPMMVRLLTHMCVTRPQWVNVIGLFPLVKRFTTEPTRFQLRRLNSYLLFIFDAATMLSL